MTGHHNTLERDVVRSGAISNRLGASAEEQVYFKSREMFRP